jgi:hypothetical protein
VWRFAHQDAEGYFLQIGDTWSSAPFGCEQNIFNQVCTDNCGFACALYSSACAGHSGTQNGEVLKAGVVVLPSGHTLNALLIRTVADFCVYLTGSCGTPLSQVRTVVHLWQVPYLGTVVRLQSPQNAPADLRSYAILDGTNIAFGLFPPRTIQATGSTSGTVSLTWDPGLDTRRITGYRVHWDTDSGSVSDYAFNSETHPGQVSLVGTTATVSGLQPGTGYFFTVTALSTFTDPSSGEITTYESERYPTQIAGDPSFVYPVEVQATTGGGTCTPVEEVGGLRVNKAAGGNIELCWTPVSDPCAVGYQVLGAPSPASPGGFVPLADTGLETCWIGSPSASYFVVAARGTGGVGPWGHFGR